MPAHRSPAPPAAALAFLAVLSGCASAPTASQQAPKGYLGVGVCPEKSGIRLGTVLPDGPGQRAGLKFGDVLVAYNGTGLDDPEQRRNFLREISAAPGSVISLSVRRYGKTVSLDARVGTKSTQDAMAPLNEALRDEIITGRKIAVAVAIGDVSNTSARWSGPDAKTAWERGMRSSLRSWFEQMLLGFKCDNLSVVDRAEVDKAMDELKFQSTGAVAPESARQLGKMTGATHLLLVDLTRYADQGVWVDIKYARLLDVESGTILGSATARNRLTAQK